MDKQVLNQKMHYTSTLHKTVTVDKVSVFYRESGNPSNPKMLLLHGFPSSSHQYRDLVSTLADHFHVVAPDYPGFGNSDLPSTDEFNYTFDRLSEIVESFLKVIGFTHFGLYMQDYGGPVGFRIISRHPDWLEWLIIQNTNAYEIGSLQLGMDSAMHYGRIARQRLRALLPLFYSLTLSSRYICMVTRIRSLLALITGIWIFCSWNVLMHGKYRWICFMTTAQMLHCIPSGRSSYVSINLRL
jgi:pimeloyl-ACP methyl ester carboxylesterase